MSMMVSFVLSFFPRDVLDEILNLIESVSEDFPSYSFIQQYQRLRIPEKIIQCCSVMGCRANPGFNPHGTTNLTIRFY